MAKSKKKEQAVYSFSKLDTYNRCSEMFRLQYVDKVRSVDTSSIETEIGSRCHDALEVFYSDPSTTDPYSVLLSQWKSELEAIGLEALYTDLNHIASDISKLLYRAGPNYTGSDAIRTGNKSIARSPELTTDWKNAARYLKLDERRQRVDRLAADVNKKWISMSLADVFATSCAILFGYKNPTEINEVLLVEMGLSDIKCVAADPADPTKKLLDSNGNTVETSRSRGTYRPWIDPKTKTNLITNINQKVTFPSLSPDGEFILDPSSKEIKYPDDNDLFNGYIDLVCRTPDGKLAVIDHKTSKGDAPSVTKVARHQQLLLYGWAIWRVTGTAPEYIGINHLRTNKLVLAPFSMEMALEALKSKLQTINGVNHNVFIKQDPYGYGSMCITDSAKGPRYCPYFDMCHPDLAHDEILGY